MLILGIVGNSVFLFFTIFVSGGLLEYIRNGRDSVLVYFHKNHKTPTVGSCEKGY